MPSQDIRRGDRFPYDEPQEDGSLFIRTDMPGLPVFQYDASNGCYFQVEGAGVSVTTEDA